MGEQNQRVVVIRHAETDWSLSGRHTGSTDLLLTEEGRRKGRLLAPELQTFTFERVFTSPLARATETCGLAGLEPHAEVRDDLMEWDYGEYEGLTSEEIRAARPGWDLWLHGAPGGEDVSDIVRRVDPFVEELSTIAGDVAVFSHGHLSTALTVRWLGLEASAGQHFVLGAGAVSELSWKRDVRVLMRWNDDAYLRQGFARGSGG